MILTTRIAGATGVGLSVSGGLSEITLKRSFSDGSSASYSLTEYLAGAGIVIDTAVAADRLFNYRCNLTYHNSFTRDVSIFSSQSYHRLLWINSFGFGFYRTDSVRIWAGPQVGLSYDFAYNARGAGSGVDDPFMMGYLGVVLGFNFHAGDRFTFSLDLGARGGYGGLLDGSGVRITRLEPFLSVAFIGRIGDTYGATEPKMKIEIDGARRRGDGTPAANAPPPAHPPQGG